jgi:membrane protease YdiL (CAAX protease family)
MDLLTAPFEVERRRRATPVVGALCVAGALMLGGVAGGQWLERQGGLGCELGLAVEGAAVHGGFIAQGLIITLAGQPGGAVIALRMALGLFAAFLLGHLLPWGSVAFLLLPPLLAHECRGHPTLRRIGFLTPARPTSLLVGLGVGAFLGAHLLITSSLTFGYAIGVLSVAAYASAVAYDVGANALSAEFLFRGALFSHWWRHWGFWGAAAVSTALTLVRYLLDPALPEAAEARAGAIVYLAALALGAAVLRAWSGSLVPGYLASVAFFAAYRALVVW